MKRVNIFNQVHKGLRAALYDTALFLQKADFTNESQAGEAIEKTREVLMLFDEHAGKEDRYILPAIQTFEPSVMDSFEQEHEKDQELSAGLENLLDAFHYLKDDQEKAAAGQRINIGFTEFMCFNLEHMAREESMINQILWRYYDDDAILEIQEAIVRSTEPWHADFFYKWMLRGINDAELQGWLRAVQATAPPVVYETLYTKAEQELPANRFQKLKASLTEGAMLV